MNPNQFSFYLYFFLLILLWNIFLFFGLSLIHLYKKNNKKHTKTGIELLVESSKQNYPDAFAELASRSGCHPGLRSLSNAEVPGLAFSQTPAFDISNLHDLPRVSVLYFNADADAELVRFAAERSAGIVIAGAGAGEFSQSWTTAIAKVVDEAKVPVVVSTRINRGCIVPEQLLVPGTIAAYSLPPAKAAVLLRLSLTITNDPVAIQNFFEASYTSSSSKPVTLESEAR